MTIETGGSDKDWEEFEADLEAGRIREEARQKIFAVLNVHADGVEDFPPGVIAANVARELGETGWNTQRFVLPEENEQLPEGSFIDIVAQDPDAGFTTALQFGFSIPTRDQVLAINYSNLPLDLAVFVATRPPFTFAKKRYLKKLATAVRDVAVDFVVYSLVAPWGEKELIGPAERDRLRGGRAAQPDVR